MTYILPSNHYYITFFNCNIAEYILIKVKCTQLNTFIKYNNITNIEY
jgi:hypothetical protein